MNKRPKTELQRLLDAFRHARYPDGFPHSTDEDALAKRLVSEFEDWCNQQGLASDLEKAEKEATMLEAVEELEDAFAKLAAEGRARSISNFSPEAINQGALKRFAESKKRRGTLTVDAAFLEEIESWRLLLAKNLALRNPILTQRELNYAVQVTIDRRASGQLH